MAELNTLIDEVIRTSTNKESTIYKPLYRRRRTQAPHYPSTAPVTVYAGFAR